jgi:hypothetical protein
LAISGGFKQAAEFLTSDYFINNLEKQVISQHPKYRIILMFLKSEGLYKKQAVAS